MKKVLLLSKIINNLAQKYIFIFVIKKLLYYT